MVQNIFKTKNLFSLSMLAMVYILFNLRYMEGQIIRTLSATGVQLLTSAPIPVGLTILVATFLKRMHGEPLPWDRVIRIYFTFGIIIGFLLALNEYWERGAQVLVP
jgi:hypothetical protein